MPGAGLLFLAGHGCYRKHIRGKSEDVFYMKTVKHKEKGIPDKFNEGSAVYAVMLYDGYYVTEDDSLSLLLREAKHFYSRKDAISILPYWQGQGYECFVIDITESIKMERPLSGEI
jgi:hypothetical protein